ncbi:hypothetical protein Trydic_g18777 [Trypoxylus dichotomus]
MTDSNFVITGEAEGLQPTQLSVKELIAATIDAMSANSDMYKNKDVSGLIPQYRGLANEDIEKWFERIDMAKRIYRVADDKMLLTIINKLGGMARDWFHSKPEHALLTLEMLKSEMVKMFKSRENKITMMKKFEARRWKKQHTHMLQVMGDIANDERRASTNRTAVVPPTNTSTRPRSDVRCSNCNQEGHISNRCPRPKQDRRSSFEWGSMGHQKRNCPQRRGESTTTPDSTTLLVEEDAVIPPYILTSNPVLSVYSPSADTELYCDASSAGFGAILMHRQDEDKKFDPVMFFSKRMTEAESKYHSYELECLAVVYAMKRFHIYLHQRKFKIITDCDSFRLTLKKKDIVLRICRWTLFLESYDYEIEHRSNQAMQRVDALSRCLNTVLVLEETTLEENLAIKQSEDHHIADLKTKLEREEDKLFELQN